MKYYKLIEWNGKGHGQTVATSHDKKYLLSLRERVLQVHEAKIFYNNVNYFFATDVPASDIVTYKSESDYKKGKEPIKVENWY